MSSSSEPVMRRHGVKTILAILLPVFVFFLFLEGVARITEKISPPLPVDLGQGFSEDSRLFVTDPEDASLWMTNPEKRVSFHEQRFSKEKPKDTFRIFTLGGSSVNYLDYEFEELAKRLAEQLDSQYTHVEIINCGGLSYGSHRLVIIAAEVMQYAPDMLLLYSGHNEFEELEQLQLAQLQVLPLQKALGHSALFRVLRDRIASHQIAALEEEHNQRIMEIAVPDSARAWQHAFTQEEVAERMATYENNLGHILQMCRDRRIPAIIGTVPSNLIKPALYGEAGERYEKEAVAQFKQGEYSAGREAGRKILQESTRHQSSDMENAVIRRLAKEFAIPLADVEAAVIAAEPHHVPGETLFGDHCHLNGEGNRIWIETYEREIRRIFP